MLLYMLSPQWLENSRQSSSKLATIIAEATIHSTKNTSFFHVPYWDEKRYCVEAALQKKPPCRTSTTMFLIYLAKRRKTLYAIIVIYVFTWNFLSCSLNIEETSCFVKWFISKEFASWGYAWTYLAMSNLILGFPWPLPVRSVISQPHGMVYSDFR